MKYVKGFCKSSMLFSAAIAAVALVVAVPSLGVAQDSVPPTDKSLVEEIRALRAKVTALEAALEQRQQGAASAMPRMSATPQTPASGKAAMGKGGMGMMGGQGMGMMGRMPPTPSATSPGSMNMPAGQGKGMMMDDMMGGMGLATGGSSMPSQPGGGMMMEGEGMDMMMMGGGMGGMSQGGGMGMGMMDDMDMMGQMPGGAQTTMGRMAIQSALPGFPGASHLYHIGATGFFLNHRQHITLTNEQRTQLNQIKEQALLAQSESRRNIDQAEQELWQLTSADQPDAAKIEGKVREIEKLRGDQRLAFIRSVGEAAKVLAPEQITSLVGQVTPAAQTGGAAPQHQP